MLGHGLPHGADCGHSSRKLLGGGGGDGGGGGGDGWGGGATAGGGGGGTGAAPPVRADISLLTHVINHASALRSSPPAASANRAARSRHSAEGSALTAPGVAAHRPSATTRAQIRALGHLSVRTLFMDRPRSSRAAAGHSARKLRLFCSLGCIDNANGTTGHPWVTAYTRARSLQLTFANRSISISRPTKVGSRCTEGQTLPGPQRPGREAVRRHRAHVPSSIANSR
jgi:hypothetical protein